jgi:ATP-binding cassette subfamily C protein
MKAFVTSFARYDRLRLAWVTGVSVVAALAQGIGLLLLVPLLEVAGVGHPTSGGITGATRHWFAQIGVTLTLRSILVAYVAVIAVVAAIGAYQTVAVTRYRITFVDTLRSQLFAAIADSEWRHLLGGRQSDLVSVLTVNIGVVYQGASALLGLITTSCLVAAQVAVALRISPTVTGLAVVTGLALTGLVWPLVTRSRRLGKALITSNRNVVATVSGFLDGLKLAKAHGMEAGHVEAFDESVRESRQAQIDFAIASSSASAIQFVVTAAFLALLVDIALEQLHVPLAQLLVLALVFMRLVPQISSAQRNIQLLAQSAPAMDELTSLIDAAEAAAEPGPAPTASTGMGAGITLTDVRFRYPSDGAPEVLHGVTLDIRGRATTALVGPSGGGKTTIADLTIGLLEPASGTVSIDGRPLTGPVRRSWRASVGVAPQDPFLFHDTVRANLLWARAGATDRDLWSALEDAAALGLVERLPHGLDTVVGDRGVRLSGGERQRIALARALLRRPELLVLDEATSSLDTEHELAIREALTRLHGEMAILVIAHRLSTVRHADTIIVIDDGLVAESGAWGDLAGLDGGRLNSLIAAGAIT